MSLRAAERGDIDRIVAMWNHAAPHDPLSADLLIENAWDDEGVAGRYVVDDGDGVQGFGLGVMRASGAGYLKMLAVAPEARRAGYGSTLLGAVESALLSKGAGSITVAGSAPNYLSPGVDDRYADGLAFLGHHGYQVTGETENMTADLTAADLETADAESRLVGQGVAVRRAEAGDQVALGALLDHFGGSWHDEVGRSMAQMPVGVHLAWRDSELLGFSAWGGNNTAAGWFGPMGTLPAARGLGIGGVLLKRCLRDLRELGFQTAVIPWVGPVPFYQAQVGAEVSARLVRMKKTIDKRSA
ncbi:GNAT family N-acetyltransferase [Marinihelvus fidelis]|uniref:GNAT family N-acetyltransferase n=1 Tax=Marinihelvus fidelis TaxID=2613842 RepID=A0A5N0TG04_9GAMM|nr:GNAT family N-acetyltransferase [Marinihelvus fidelis]KAA9132806.1 GNAT family N-acetyltransferase [Marinihelvus fidelis]